MKQDAYVKQEQTPYVAQGQVVQGAVMAQPVAPPHQPHVGVVGVPMGAAVPSGQQQLGAPLVGGMVMPGPPNAMVGAWSSSTMR